MRSSFTDLREILNDPVGGSIFQELKRFKWLDDPSSTLLNWAQAPYGIELFYGHNCDLVITDISIT